ncbi:hypothetical protein BU24DRAFT_459379 [Aaosphaeria arxii CBS 175.79]|uniref:Zn(2)-C6 fungal-type domain-containing protein n=1 Tax=Aaosphaeria arxii CBS 175.79 TaxID=1450172 RepID=A0A6A5Y3E4_9PLEO|nr:uncharacterized protein BU24DRAFT_459379 [Aaosphaeria arxii CBS 175.79]KAF2019743.1 hypothetical protein BU24DRAFT_459379 [Aaosphaeria arxii CBS 175.79]
MPRQPQTTKRRTESSSTPNATSGKRTRVSRACDQCRTAREKCDGQPICSTCSASNRSCTYTTNPKKRGIQPGYIRTLELALTWLFNNSDAEALLNQKLAQEGAQSVLLGRETKESNKLHRTWRKSRFCKDVDKLLSGGDIGTMDDGRSPESDDQESENDDIDQTGESTTIQFDSIVLPQQSPVAHRVMNAISQSTIPQATVMPVNRWRLFDIYFSYTHSWFPISEKHDILKLTYSYPESGLDLAPDMPDSGDHAELWSILALASIQDRTTMKDSQSELPEDIIPEKLYHTARSLIPRELGVFQLGHAKALLLLSMVNLSQAAPESAWLLVGYAARILMLLLQRESALDPRIRHVFAGCFLLDNLISMQLKRSPYLRIADIERVGKIIPDGLEEWQPWSGCLGYTSRQPSRTPALSLSSFNHLVELIGIAGSAVASNGQQTSLQEALGRMELWKAALQPMFDHIRSEQIPVPPTPPAMILQIFYTSSALLLFSSQTWMQRTIDTLELFRDTLGLVAMPPVLQCLFDIIGQSEHIANIDQRCGNRLQSLRTEHMHTWSLSGGDGMTLAHGDPTSSRQGRSNTTEPSLGAPSFGSANVQMPTPESIQIPFNTTMLPLSNVDPIRPRTNSNLLDEILPDMNATATPSQSLDFAGNKSMQEYSTSQFTNLHNPPPLEHRGSANSRDIENFFDELASLDGAERLENQPQFMQNLGFAPDANIADLLSSDFGQINPLVSPYLHHNAPDSAHFNQNTFFNEG